MSTTATAQSTRIRVSDHAQLRWQQRSGNVDKLATVAWREGVNVGVASHQGTARLHPPSDTLLLARDGVLVTVFSAEYTKYRAEHLIACDHCKLEFRPSKQSRHCPWCEQETDS